MNVDQAIMEFRSAMERQGFGFRGELVPDTSHWERFYVEGDAPSTQNGYYQLHTDGRPNGLFGTWKGEGKRFKWVSEVGGVPATTEQRSALKAKIVDAKMRWAKEQQEKHAAAAEKANSIWDAATPVTESSHPYLRVKKVQAYGIRTADWCVESRADADTGEIRATTIKNALLVPIRRGKKIVSLQAIFPPSKNAASRNKDFLRDGEKRACFHTIGEPPADFASTDVMILCEGYATGATIHDATGRFVVICFDAGNISPVAQRIRDRYSKAEIVMAADNDCWGSDPKTNPGVDCANKAQDAVDGIVVVPKFRLVADKPTDFNDLAATEGLEEVKYQIESGINRAPVILPVVDPHDAAKSANAAEISEPVLMTPADMSLSDTAGIERLIVPVTLVHPLGVGSDVEIAETFCRLMEERFGKIVFAETAFWLFDATHWTEIDPVLIQRSIQRFDGKMVAESRSVIKLTSGRITSIIKIAGTNFSDEKFFAESDIGINCAAGFITFDKAGAASLEPHSPNHRCRHVLPGRWTQTAPVGSLEGSLLGTLLGGVFKGDSDEFDKLQTLAEIAGAAILGLATKLKKPKAIILLGVGADNGKSQILDLFRGLLPASAISAISPGEMHDKHQIIGLAGKLLNARDELSSAAAISSEIFKMAVTGNPISGRDLYASVVGFKPLAQHVYSTNQLPAFSGGMDRGVQRRLLVVEFNRTIPDEEQIEMIGERITQEEPDLLLAWAISGAERLLRQGRFTIAKSSKDALRDWLFSADPVAAWVMTEVTVHTAPGSRVQRSYAHEQFKAWAVEEGFDAIPGMNSFVQRVMANAKGVKKHRTANQRFFENMTINSGTDNRQDDASMTAARYQ